MPHSAPEMTDLVFALSGRTLPAAHAYELWREVARVLPWLEGQKQAGILPLRANVMGSETLLPQRAKLVLRVPAGFLGQAQGLAGQALNVGGHTLLVGEGRERPLQPHATLHAQIVASHLDESEFLAAMADQLCDLGVDGRCMCGKFQVLEGSGGKIKGYSLVVHELEPLDSLHLQRAGLGGERHLGCGMFIPYKVIGHVYD
jgi:CRISPR-associated protein Cas6